MTKIYLKSFSALVCIFLSSNFVHAQNWDFSGEINAEGFKSTDDNLPFWMSHNRRGRISEETNYALWANIQADYDMGREERLEIGGGIFYDNARQEDVFLDELFLQYRNSWFQITAGVKQKQDFYNGLSATNENILWSLNAQPLPGLQLTTPHTIFFGKREKLGFDASWQEYYMGDNRFVKHTLLHHKYFHLIYKPREDWEIKAGIQHFAQWGGDSPLRGKQPVSFLDYLRVITARNGAEGAVVGDQENALGNHLGSYELYITKQYPTLSLQFIYNSIFEDGSGSRMENIPDGRYGLFLKFNNEDQLITSILYEYYYLRNQSNKSSFGPDNYFNNGPIYNSGWMYNYRILGLPFVTYSKEKDRVINNKLVAHHLGISGHIKSYWNDYPFKVLLSFSHNEGTYHSPLRPDGANEDFLNFFTQFRLINNPFLLNAEIAATLDTFNNPIYAAGIRISKNF